jgi:cytochrome c553
MPRLCRASRGQSAETSYCVENAKSNRASCKVCKGKIEKEALRIGTCAPGPGDYMMTSWRHLDCQKKPKGLTDLAMLCGLTSLSAADQKQVEDWFAAATAPKPTATASKKRSADDAAGAPAGLGGADLKKMKAAGAHALHLLAPTRPSLGRPLSAPVPRPWCVLLCRAQGGPRGERLANVGQEGGARGALAGSG